MLPHLFDLPELREEPGQRERLARYEKRDLAAELRRHLLPLL